jgi:hypothetical protein
VLPNKKQKNPSAPNANWSSLKNNNLAKVTIIAWRVKAITIENVLINLKLKMY